MPLICLTNDLAMPLLKGKVRKRYRSLRAHGIMQLQHLKEYIRRIRESGRGERRRVVPTNDKSLGNKSFERYEERMTEQWKRRERNRFIVPANHIMKLVYS